MPVRGTFFFGTGRAIIITDLLMTFGAGLHATSFLKRETGSVKVRPVAAGTKSVLWLSANHRMAYSGRQMRGWVGIEWVGNDCDMGDGTESLL